MLGPLSRTVFTTTPPPREFPIPDDSWPGLASDAMSGYVTGQVIEVNGGQYMP